jgi:AcrR family transcriptional regulator
VVEAAPTRRRYDSRRRRAQAAETRAVILEAAGRLFERDGYVNTTMEAIALEAGVAGKTVYAAFTTKSRLLRSLWDLLLKGDQDDAPVAQRAWYRDMIEEPDPARQLRMNARQSAAVKARIGPLLRVISEAASVDDDSAALWQLIQSDFYANQRALVDSIHDHGGLRADLDPAIATDILWTLNHPNTWLLLVERGWTPDQFEIWLGEVTSQQLLTESARPATRQTGPRAGTS